MANETPQSKEDVIAIDDLVAPQAGAVEAALGKAPAEPGNEGAAAPPPAASPGVKSVDELLAVEDPSFAQAMQDLKKQGSEAAAATPAVDFDSLDFATLAKEKNGKIRALIWVISRPFERYVYGAESPVMRALRLIPKIVPATKQAAKRGLELSKEGAKLGFAQLKRILSDYSNLPGRSKFILWSAVLLGILAVATLKFSMGAKFTLISGPKFLNSFADIADAEFTYEEDEPLEEFTDPLFHPEHVVMMDKLVINLKSPGDGSNPMGLFAFYFETSNQECAVEMKDREGEARDLVSRTLEQMTYSELITPAGKEKLKLILRKNLNSILSRGQIRRVFLKNIVLKI